MIVAADYPFLEIALTMMMFFAWVVWVWVLVLILSDVFGRDDLSGAAKAAWTLFAIVLPFLGVLSYVVAHGDEISERRAARGRRHGSHGATAEIAGAKHLLDEGAIDEAEYEQLKHRVLA